MSVEVLALVAEWAIASMALLCLILLTAPDKGTIRLIEEIDRWKDEADYYKTKADLAEGDHSKGYRKGVADARQAVIGLSNVTQQQAKHPDLADDTAETLETEANGMNRARQAIENLLD